MATSEEIQRLLRNGSITKVVEVTGSMILGAGGIAEKILEEPEDPLFNPELDSAWILDGFAYYAIIRGLLQMFEGVANGAKVNGVRAARFVTGLAQLLGGFLYEFAGTSLLVLSIPLVLNAVSKSVIAAMEVPENASDVASMRSDLAVIAGMLEALSITSLGITCDQGMWKTAGYACLIGHSMFTFVSSLKTQKPYPTNYTADRWRDPDAVAAEEVYSRKKGIVTSGVGTSTKPRIYGRNP